MRGLNWKICPVFLVLGAPGAQAALPAPLYVSPSGSDTNPGTLAKPFGTLARALTQLQPGGTLYLRGGTYRERTQNPRLQAGTAQQPITVQPYAAEKPVLIGLLWLKNASYWRVSGLEVRWGAENLSSEHMVKFTGGTGWRLTGSTLSGTHSFAALLVAGDASDWTVSHNTIWDTFRANGPNQDHLIYVNSTGRNGLIERNTLLNSPNGRAIKVGPASATAGSVTGGLIIRYNTMQNNLGPSNIQLAWNTSNVLIERNLMVRPAAGRSAVTAFELSGQNNIVRDNLVWNAVRVLDSGVPGLMDGGGNRLADPTEHTDDYGAGAK